MTARARQYGRGAGRYPQNRTQLDFQIKLMRRNNKQTIEFHIMALNKFEANAKAFNQLNEQNLDINDYVSISVKQIILD